MRRRPTAKLTTDLIHVKSMLMEVPSYADMVRALTRLLRADGLLVLVEAELSFVSGLLVLLTPGVCERDAGAGRRQVVCGRAPRDRRDGQCVPLGRARAAAGRGAARRGRRRHGAVVSRSLLLPPPSFAARAPKQHSSLAPY